MRRAAAIVITVGVGLAVAYVAHERATNDSSRDEAPPASTAAPVPSKAASNPSMPRQGAAPPAVPARGSADASPPASMAPIRAADDPGERRVEREPQPEVLGEHDDEFANRYLEIAERFRSETRDPTTAVSLERQILDRFAAITGLAVTTLDVSCKATRSL